MNNLVKILLFSTTVLVMCNNASKCMEDFSENAYSHTAYNASSKSNITSEIDSKNQYLLFAQNGAIQQFEEPNKHGDDKKEIDLKDAAKKYSELKQQYLNLDKRVKNKIKIFQRFIQNYNKLLEEEKVSTKNNTNSNTVENKIKHIVIDKKTAELLGYEENETVTPFDIIKVTKEQIIKLNKNVNSDNFKEISKKIAEFGKNLINVISTLEHSITNLSTGEIPDNLYKNAFRENIQDITRACKSIDDITTDIKWKDKWIQSGELQRYLDCCTSLIDSIENLEDVINIIYNNELIVVYRTKDYMLSLQHYIQRNLNNLIKLHKRFKEQKIDNDNSETVQDKLKNYAESYQLQKNYCNYIFKSTNKFIIISNNVERVRNLLTTLAEQLGIIE